VLGPLENADLVGLDLTLQIHDYILKFIESSPAPSPLLRQKLATGELGFKTGRGFYTWDPESMGQCRKGLVDHLIRWNVEHRPEAQCLNPKEPKGLTEEQE
jgi:3-hydroxybutyryl-CoA dehydrogenase